MKTKIVVAIVVVVVVLVAALIGGLSFLRLYSAEEAYVYFYPLVTFGTFAKVKTNVEKPDWKMLAAPPNQFVSVPQAFPCNKDVLLPSTDTMYSMAWLDVTKEPLVFEAPAIPDLPNGRGKRFMMFSFLDAWSNVFDSSGLQKGVTTASRFVLIGPDYQGTIPSIPGGEVKRSPTNQIWLIARTQVEGPDDLTALHAVQEQYAIVPLGAYGKPYTPPPGKVDPTIDMAPAPDQVNAMDGRAFFTTASTWFNKVPLPALDQQAGIAKALARVGIRHGERFDWDALSPAQRSALDRAVRSVQEKLRASQATPPAMKDLTNGWAMPNPNQGNYGTDYILRAATAYLGFGANLSTDAFYLRLLRDSRGAPLQADKKYTLTFPAGQLPPAGAFWSVTMYEAGYLVPNPGARYAISNWMPLHRAADGSVTIYMQAQSPGPDLEANWLPTVSDGSCGNMIPPGTPAAPAPFMRIYWPLPAAVDHKWSPPPVVEVP